MYHFYVQGETDEIPVPATMIEQTNTFRSTNKSHGNSKNDIS